MCNNTIQRLVHQLDVKFGQRSTPSELVARGLAYDKFWELEASEVERQRKQRFRQAKEILSQSLCVSPRPEIVGIVVPKTFLEDDAVIQDVM